MRIGTRFGLVVCVLLVLQVSGTACGGGRDRDDSSPVDVVVDTSFLADIVRNVVGERLTVAYLIPEGADPHSFEPTPRDAQMVAECRAVVINIAGLSPMVDELVVGAVDPDAPVIEAAAGIEGVKDDPHCWLAPLYVVTYAENIAEGLAEIDPEGADIYESNARSYAESLETLDSWIRTQVETVPLERRLLVTNHESLNWFADQYGMRVVGTIFPTTAGEGSPSARQIADLVADIRGSGAPAVFVEIGGNEDLASQVAQEAGVVLVGDLLTGSLSVEAPDYLAMMRWDVQLIVGALR